MPGPRVALKIMYKNPNPGEQCVCSPNSKVSDCKPPFCVFTHSESMNARAPHIVVGDRCMRAGVEKAHPGAFKVKTVTVTEPAPELDFDTLLKQIRSVIADSVGQ